MPSRRVAANHSGPSPSGAPSAANRAPIGVRSDRVSLTSNTTVVIAIPLP